MKYRIALPAVAATAALALAPAVASAAQHPAPARPHISGALLVTGSNSGGPVLYLSGVLSRAGAPTVYLDGHTHAVRVSFYPDSEQHQHFIEFAAVPLFGSLASEALAGHLTVAVHVAGEKASNTVQVLSPEQEAVSGPGAFAITPVS